MPNIVPSIGKKRSCTYKVNGTDGWTNDQGQFSIPLHSRGMGA
jgi:hypothetical protein